MYFSYNFIFRIIPPYIWMLSSDWLMKGVFFTVVCHFSFLYRWLKEETRIIRNYTSHRGRDVINYLKKGFSHERGICLLVPWYLLIPRYTEFPRTKTPPMGKSEKKLRIGKKKIHLLSTNQKKAFIYKTIIPPYIWMLSSDWLMKGVFFTNP